MWTDTYTRFQCYLRRRHLSTCYVNLVYIKMLAQRTPLIYSRPQLQVMKDGLSRSHSVRDKSTLFNVYIFRIVSGLILPEVTIESCSTSRKSFNFPINLETRNVHIFFSHVRSVIISILYFLPLIIREIACSTVKRYFIRLKSMSKDGMSKDERGCHLCT